MAKNSIDAYGAEGKSNVLFFDPDKLTLVTEPTHPLYDSRVHWPLDEAMVRNIMFHNVRQPIEVSKNPETGEVEVVTGRQRVKNAREANRRLRERGEPILLIPAVAVKVASCQRALTLSAAMASENAIRQQETPSSRAEKMAKQLALGRSEEELGVIFGCGVPTVRATLQLLECCAAVQKAVDAGQITVTHAKQLARMSPADQRAKVEELIAAGDGVKPHERARKQREVLGDKKSRMKTRAQIEKELAGSDGDRASALRWVLGLEAATDAEAAL